MTAVEASSADVELRARATGFVRRVRALGGRRVIEVDARGERNAGALVRSDGQSIAAGARAAREQRLPLLIRIASSGADAGEGVSALDGWAGAAKEITANSGVVPSIAIVSGPTVSGPALMLGLVDHVIMTSEAYAFVSGPMMVEEFTGVPMSKEELGGPSVHDRTSGVASFVAGDEEEAEALAAELLAFLPDHTDDHPPTITMTDPVERPTPDAYEVLPPSANGSYDVRDIVGAVVDDGYLLEPMPTGRPTWSRRSPRSADSPSVSWRTNPKPSLERSISRRARKAAGLSPSVTRSTFRSSRLSTRRASTRARTPSGGA